MSQFDFPRIHFSGYTTINPGTGNNNYHLPLCYYDPINNKAILPPRIYLQAKYLSKHISLEEFKLLIPDKSAILSDESNVDYIEICPVSKKESFINWATTPLGQCEIDKDYHKLYKYLVPPKLNAPLFGEYPGYWNLFGDMTFLFNQVTIKSVQLDESDQIKTYTAKNTNIPEILNTILGAELSLSDSSGKPTAVMIDVLPTEAYYTQVFCDELRIIKEQDLLLCAKPSKGSVRLYNTCRIVNQNNILGASGTFYSVIKSHNVDGIIDSTIFNFVKENCDNPHKLKGLFLRYDLFEVIENRIPLYGDQMSKGNPARSTIVGSISPWYENEMESFTLGRLLVPEVPFSDNKTMASLISQIDFNRKRVSFDLVGNIPEFNNSIIKNKDSSNFPQEYETFNLGKIEMKLENEKGERIDIGNVVIGPNDYNRESLLLNGGIIDFVYNNNESLNEKDFQNGHLLILSVSENKKNAIINESVLLRESDYLITTDQIGLYTNEGDDPANGYISYGRYREPCYLRIFTKGRPVKEPIKINFLQYSITLNGTEIKSLDQNSTLELRDMDKLNFDLSKASNSIFLITPDDSINIITNFIPEILKRGSFINLRVLPNPSYEKYLDPSHSEYTDKIPYDFLYEEIFKMFDLIYPISSIISPFDQKAIQRAIPILKKLMNPLNWSSNSYMPSSRDLSQNQYELFLKWCNDIQNNFGK